MFSRICLAMFLVLAVAPVTGAPASVIETKYLDSTILRENRIGLNPVRRIKVYLPPGYARSNARYPVIYLLHSLNWDNERMFAPGSAAQPTRPVSGSSTPAS